MVIAGPLYRNCAGAAKPALRNRRAAGIARQGRLSAYAEVVTMDQNPASAGNSASERHLCPRSGAGLRPHLPRVTVAYRSYGTLNAAKSNAILICHALTGDQYVAERNPETGKPGWWDIWSGPASRWIRKNISSSAPMCWAAAWAPPGRAAPHADGSGQPWGTDFPQVTIHDMVRAQKLLVEPSRHCPAVRGHRRLHGRHAGAGLGGAVPRGGVRRRARRHRLLPFGAEHRLPRDRPPGHRRRPVLLRGPLLGAGRAPRRAAWPWRA